MTNILDAGHVYSPRFRPADGPEWKNKPGSCCAAVHESGRGVSFYQCTKKAKYTREVMHRGQRVTLEYCGIHDPEFVRRKNIKWRTEYDARRAEEQAQRDAKKADRILRDAALEAIRKIAAGHNDPRSLAMEVLS
jgi:hypothetical protein